MLPTGLFPNFELASGERVEYRTQDNEQLCNVRDVANPVWGGRVNWGRHRMMPVTANHVAFVLSFASAFVVCYVGSQLLSSVLNNAGYDLFGTILGQEKQAEDMTSQLMKDFSNNQLAQLVAIALTAITSVVIFWKFSQSEFNPVYVWET